MLKKSAKIKLQSISSTIRYKNTEISLDDLEPFSILSSNYHPPSQQDVVHSPLWKKEVNGTLILAVKDGRDRIEHISIFDGDDREDIVAIHAKNNPQPDQPILYTTISMSDYDDEKIDFLAKNHKDAFKYFTTRSRPTTDEFAKSAFVDSSQKSDHCTSFKIIEVAIAYDSTLCESFDYDKDSTDRHVQALVGLASKFYEPMCLKLKISYIEGYCSTSNDPFERMVRSESILERFTASWRSNRDSVPRDVAHLLTGSNFEKGVLGMYLLLYLFVAVMTRSHSTLVYRICFQVYNVHKI